MGVVIASTHETQPREADELAAMPEPFRQRILRELLEREEQHGLGLFDTLEEFDDPEPGV